MAPIIQRRYVLCVAILLFVLLIPKGPLPGIDFAIEVKADGPQPLGTTDYHSLNETIDELNQIATDHPGITKLVSIGKSYEGRDIWAMKVSDNPDIEEDEPEIFYNGNHHAREWLTIEVCLYILNYLTDNYLSNSTITNIVDNRQIWVVPCVNPDGREYDNSDDDPSIHSNQPAGWRKNRADNGDGSFGVDLNRNYDYMWGGAGASDVPSSQIYRGTEGFSENETRAIRNFVREHDFIFSISYHTSGQLILYPWGYTYNKSEDDELFRVVGENMAGLITNKAGSSYPGYTPQQGSDLYMTSGTDDDWLYGEMGIYAYCIELYPDHSDNDAAVTSPYDSFHPRADKVIPVCEDNIEAALYLAKISDNPFQIFDHHVSLSTQEDSQLINQTETKDFTITVTNDGANDGIFNLSNSTIPGWTITINPPTMLLFSGSSMPVTLSVTVPFGESGGEYHIWVYATSQDNTSVTDSLLVTVIVPYLNDVGVQSIDTFFDGGTYPVGFYTINSTVKNYGRNSQSDFNTSLEIVKLGPLIPKAVFSDDMESGANGWQVVDLDGSTSAGSWKQVTSSSNSPTTSWWCGTTNNYDNLTAQLLISPSFSLKWAESADILFYHKYVTENNYDYCSVDVSDGSSWTTLASYDGSGPSGFEQQSITIDDFVGLNNVQFRFRFNSDNFLIDDGWYIDDVEVTGLFPTETTVYGPVLNHTTGIMAQDAAQQLGWNFTFTEVGDYKIYSTTLLKTDEQQVNNQSVVKINIEPSPGSYSILKQGWNLISTPRIQVEQNITKVLEPINGLYDAVQWSDITDFNDPWKHYKVGKSNGNDLTYLNETMGFWVHITQPGDTIFLNNGTIPTQNHTILLYPGWNMVGYPTLSNFNRTQGLNNLSFGSDIDAIWTFSAETQTWVELGEWDYFTPGKGYWIHSKVEKTWEVPL